MASPGPFYTGTSCLINIELDHVILDELHLLLRVVDVLLKNLGNEVVQWDRDVKMDRNRRDRRGVQREKLQFVVRSSCGSFDIWEKTNADGKEAGSYDFTSLLRNDKKQLLRELTGELPNQCLTTNHFHKCCKNMGKFQGTICTYWEWSTLKRASNRVF